jgi:hypothetical protein
MTITIIRGETYSRVLRPTAKPYIYIPITAITNSAPVMIAAPGHRLVTGQFAAVVSVKGMREINAELDSKGEPRLTAYRKVTVIDANTITINDVNASDFGAYTSGGYLQYFTPIDMSGCTARRSIKDKEGGTVLLSLTTENGGLTIDNVNHTITETISAVDTAAITWRKGVSDIELVTTASGYVSKIMADSGSTIEDVVVLGEITT